MARLGRMDIFCENLDDVPEHRQSQKEHIEGEWECTMCGYIHEGRRPPRACPDCGADADEFEFFEYVD